MRKPLRTPAPSQPRHIRITSGNSLRATAAKLGVSAPHLCDLERGFRHWTPAMQTRWEAVMQQPFPAECEQQ